MTNGGDARVVQADERRVLALFEELVRINSPSRSERRIADSLAGRLKALGFRVSEDATGQAIGGEAGNVIGWLDREPDGGNGAEGEAAGRGASGGRGAVLLCAHMDTVQPTEGINVIVDGGVIRTDGRTILGADDKAGIAAILEGLSIIRDKGLPHPPVCVAFTVAEEVGLYGAKNLALPEGLEFGYVFDSGSPVGTFVIKAPAENDIAATIHGRAAHAGVEPEKGADAIRMVAAAIDAMPLGRIDHETTANVGVIQGGKATNIVADRVELRAEARSHSRSKLSEQTEKMKQALEEAARRLGGKAEVAVSPAYPNFELLPDDKVVTLALRAAQSLGMTVRTVPRGGGSDANVFNGKGLPTLNVGLGMEAEHTTAEHVPVASLTSGAEFVATLLVDAAAATDGGASGGGHS